MGSADAAADSGKVDMLLCPRDRQRLSVWAHPKGARPSSRQKRTYPTQLNCGGGLFAKQPSRQQALHVASAIGNQDDKNLLPVCPVNQPVGFEKGLAVFADAKRQ